MLMPENEDINVTDDNIVDDVVPKKNPEPVPYVRFRQVVQQRRDLETKLATMESALSAAETAKLAAAQKYDELDTSTKAAIDSLNAKLLVDSEALTKYKEMLTSTVDDTTKDWPDEVKI